MFRKPTLRAVVLAVGLLSFVGCASGGSSAGEHSTGVATTALVTAQSTLDLSTPSPAITAAAAATSFAPASGWWDDAVCYEVFVRSFFDSNGDGIGDIKGLMEKLDYLNDGSAQNQQDLGVNCIWLMPINESPAYHGYHVTDFYSVESDYGTNDDFKQLVAEAHKRGIRVVIDLVLNHTAREHPWFQEALNNPQSPYRDWYLWSKDDPGYKGPWGQQVWHRTPAGDAYYYGVFNDQIPDLNYRNPAVTEEARKITTFWRNEMGVDGFRLDAIKHLIENGQIQENTPETHVWLRGYRSFLEQSLPGTFTIGEIFDATPTILAPYYPDQLHTYFVFDLGARIITAASQGNGKPFASAAQRVNDSLPLQRYAPFLTNHDQNRSMGLLGNNVGKARIAATALLTLPGLPFVYYGEEIGMLGAKGNPPKVDEPLRTPMQWSGDEHGGFTSGTPWEALQSNYREVHVAAQEEDASSLLNLYRKLIHLHTTNPALSGGSLTTLQASENDVAAYVRQKDDQAVLVVLNFDKEAVTGATLRLDKSTLTPGAYRLEALLGDQPGAGLTVGEGGTVTDYAPLPTLAPYTGYIFTLSQ